MARCRAPKIYLVPSRLFFNSASTEVNTRARLLRVAVFITERFGAFFFFFNCMLRVVRFTPTPDGNSVKFSFYINKHTNLPPTYLRTWCQMLRE